MVVVMLGLVGPAVAFDINQLSPDTPPDEALRFGLTSHKSGDTATAIEALNFAAEKGLAGAQWKLGQMYATGDGVERDDYHAFELFSAVADTHAEDGPRGPSAPYVSNAFVKLGTYYRQGIPDTDVKPDLGRARFFFSYAASYFANAEAQLSLARMYYSGEGGARDLIQAAKWANLSLTKGNPEAKFLLIDVSVDLAWAHLKGEQTAYNFRQAAEWAKRAADFGSVDGQAIYGHLLFEGIGVRRGPIEGLTYLSIALARADPSDQWILEWHQQARSAATEAEWRAAKQRADEWLAQNPGKVAAAVTAQ